MNKKNGEDIRPLSVSLLAARAFCIGTRRGGAGHAGGLRALNGTTRSVSRNRGGSDRPLQVRGADGGARVR